MNLHLQRRFFFSEQRGRTLGTSRTVSGVLQLCTSGNFEKAYTLCINIRGKSGKYRGDISGHNYHLKGVNCSGLVHPAFV